MVACASPELFRILVVMFQRELGDFFQVLRIPFRVQCSHAKSAGLLARSLAEFERTAASGRRLSFSPTDFVGAHDYLRSGFFVT